MTFFILLFTSLLAGCPPANPPPVVPQTVTMTCKQPIFVPLAETKELQEKGGLQISVAPFPYTCTQSNKVSTQVIPDPVSKTTAGLFTAPPPRPGARYVETIETPVLQLRPERLQFIVKVNNKLPRVFRGAGIVVQFNVAGKLQAVEQQGYAALTNVLVPPRTEQQVEISGPSIVTIPEQTTIGLFLYDIVTNTDAAGNITEKHNFEWFYNYAVQQKEEVGTIRRTEGWK